MLVILSSNDISTLKPTRLILVKKKCKLYQTIFELVSCCKFFLMRPTHTPYKLSFPDSQRHTLDLNVPKVVQSRLTKDALTTFVVPRCI